MSGGMPELGSKISLISKADIRYEGRLFTVDPNECTIALASVRSYGTEDRETQFPISPQNQVYDYILFRGSDIKDIRVINNVPVPNDPAIMQMQLPSNQMGAPPFQPVFPSPVMGHMGPGQIGDFGRNPPPTWAVRGMPGGLTATGLAPGSSLPNPGSAGMSQPVKGPMQTQQQHQQASEFSVGMAETLRMGVESKDQAAVLDLIGGGSRSTTPVSLISRKSPTADMAVQVDQPRENNIRRNSQQSRGNMPRERRDSGRMDNHSDMRDNRDRNNQRNNYNNYQNNQHRGWLRNNNQRGGRPRGRGQQQMQSFRQMGNLNKGRPKTTIKFESDYDFEQANSKFEELRLELSKLKVGGDEAKPDQVNGETDKKDDSGNETAAGDHEHEEEDITVGYDKAKSFFDNISCEAATDRTKGKNRTDWRLERKINTETFGVGSSRRGYYHNYRGRGGNSGGSYFNNRNMNMNYRGGYRSGGFRPRNFNKNPPNTSTGLPQNDKAASQPPQANAAVAIAAAN